MIILLRDSNETLERDCIFKPTILNEHLREIIKDYGVGVVKLCHTKE
jgi:hypothetical protein